MNTKKMQNLSCLSHNGLLSKENAEELFNHEAVYLSNNDCIPCYRAAEIFGEWIKRYTLNDLKDGSLCNAIGNCHERPMIYYLSKQGFMRIVAEYNYRLIVNELKEKGISGELVESEV